MRSFRFIPLFLFFSLPFLALGQKSPAKKLAQKYQYCTYCIQQGKLDEAIGEGRKTINKFNKEAYCKKELYALYELVSEAQFLKGAYQESAQTLKKIEQVDNNTSTAQLYTAKGYLFWGKSKLAASFLKHLNLDSLNDTEQIEAHLLQAKINMEQGFYRKASEILEATEKAVEDSAYVHKKGTDGKASIQYAQIQILKTQALIAQGYIPEASKAYTETLQWLKTRLPNEKHFFATLLFSYGKLQEKEKNYVEALKTFRKGYYYLGTGKLAPKKAVYLYHLCKNSYASGNIVTGDGYLRELQMYSFQLAGWKEPMQPWYELAMAARFHYTQDINKAWERLTKIDSKYSGLPNNTAVVQAYYEAKANIALAKSSEADYNKAKAALLAAFIENQGAQTPAAIKESLFTSLENLKFQGLKATSLNNLSEQVRLVTNELNPSGKETCTLWDYAAQVYFLAGKKDSALYFSSKATSFKPSSQKEEVLLSNYFDLQHALYAAYTGNLESATAVIAMEDSIQQNASSYSVSSLKVLLLLNKLYLLTEENNKSLKLAEKLKGFSKPVHLYLNKQQALETELAFASIFKDAGIYYKAEKTITDALKEAKINFPSTAFTLPFLQLQAEINLINGNFEDAEKNIKEALGLAEEFYDKNSLRYAQVNSIYLDYFDAIADYKSALDITKETESVYEKTLGDKNIYQGELLLTEANLLIKSQKASQKIISDKFRQSIAISEKSFGKNSEKYNKAITQYANYLIQIKSLKEAEQLLQTAYTYYKSGSNHLTFAKLLLTRSNLYYAKKDYAKAETAIKTATDLLQSNFSAKHPLVVKTKADLAKAYYMQQRPKKSLQMMEEVIPVYLNYIEELFPSMSFRQKAAYWSYLKDGFEFYNFLVFKLNEKKTKKTVKTGQVYNNIMATKAILLASDKKIRKSIEASNDSILVADFEKWVSLKEVMGRIYNYTQEEQERLGINVDKTEKALEALERKLSSRSADFASKQSKTSVSWEKVKDRLHEDECVVEMVRVRNFDQYFQDSAFYMALVLTSSSEAPQVITIPDALSLEGKYYKYYRNTLVLDLDDQYSYPMYWEAIAKGIEGKKHIYFSPDGVYYQINPETFQEPNGKFLTDDVSFTFLTNSKNLINKETPTASKEIPSKPTFFLAGNPLYYPQGEQGSIPALPGTATEVKAIAQIVDSAGFKAKILMGKVLTEDTVKTFQDATIMHFATHGYFKESTYEDASNMLEEPLLNSGLLFSGSGEIIDKKENINAKEGILTAFEVASMNLSQTDLVVLSACETGRGEVKNGEGVFGLQRAFLAAGADALIMSLFKVNDEVTAKFMQYFYQDLVISGNKFQAFKTAKERIKKEFPSPRNWGSFIFVESTPKKELSTEYKSAFNKEEK